MYGARPLKRLIQASLLNPLATLLLEDKIAAGASIHVGVEGEGPAPAAAATPVAAANPDPNPCPRPLRVEQAAGVDPALNRLRFWVK